MTASRAVWLALALALALATAAPATARAAAPRWTEEPRVLSTHLIQPAGGSGDVVATFAVPLQARAPQGVTVQVFRAGTRWQVARSEVTWSGGWLTARWPSSTVHPGEPYDVRLCARSQRHTACSGPAHLRAPRDALVATAHAPPAPRPRIEPGPVLAALLGLVGLLLARRRRVVLV